MLYLILCVILYTIALLFGAIGARHLTPIVATAVNNIIAAILPLLLVIPLINNKLLSNQNTKYGIIMAAISGIFVALFVLTLNKTLSVNKVGIVVPVVYAGTIFLTTILSAFVFKEKITMLQSVGLGFLAIGFVVIIYVKATGN